MALGDIPKIEWDAGPNTLDFGYPLDNAAAFSAPREGSEWASGPSGQRDAWIVGTAHRLAADVRWIPTADTTNPVATGWDGATGWRAFLEFARDANSFTFFPDKDSAPTIPCVLIQPMTGEPGIESDGTRTLRLIIESTDGSAFTGF